MMEILTPWLGLAMGIILTVTGVRWAWRPEAQVGVGAIPASDPKTVRVFGIIVLVMGLLGASLNLTALLQKA